MKMTKELRMLDLFVNGFRLNKLEAGAHGDTCLNTTISKLQQKHQIQFSKKSEKRKNGHGDESSFTRYWLEGEDLERARCVVHRSKQRN